MFFCGHGRLANKCRQALHTFVQRLHARDRRYDRPVELPAEEAPLATARAGGPVRTHLAGRRALVPTPRAACGQAPGGPWRADSPGANLLAGMNLESSCARASSRRARRPGSLLATACASGRLRPPGASRRRLRATRGPRSRRGPTRKPGTLPRHAPGSEPTRRARTGPGPKRGARSWNPTRGRGSAGPVERRAPRRLGQACCGARLGFPDLRRATGPAAALPLPVGPRPRRPVGRGGAAARLDGRGRRPPGSLRFCFGRQVGRSVGRPGGRPGPGRPKLARLRPYQRLRDER
jgi:hypothetical protein